MKKPVLGLFVFLIKMYQVFLSTHFGGACRFYPSCSRYAEQALLSYPLLRAFRLIFKRLLRCHSFGPFGLDPCHNSPLCSPQRSKPIEHKKVKPLP